MCASEDQPKDAQPERPFEGFITFLPMRSLMQSIEEGTELREICLKYHEGCRKYTEGLREAYDGDIAFASSLEAFGGGHNDPISEALKSGFTFLATRLFIYVPRVRKI